jgi:5,10-methylenetetrahydromethanopterin reductase
MSDHLKGRNIHICLTAVALKTKKILLGPGITNPYYVHPVTTAQILSSLNELAPGRLVCGLGAGDSTNLKRVGIKQEKPVVAVREATQIIRSILLGDTVNIDGKIFKISNQNFGFPRSDMLPILIGAQREKMLKMAGAVGDGVIINAADSLECELAIKIVRRSAELEGKQLSKFEFAAAMPFSVARKSEDAIKQVLLAVAVIAAGSPDSILKRHGISLEGRDKVRDALLHNDYDSIIKSVTPEMINSLSISGTPEICIEKISALVNSGVSLVVLSTPLGPEPEKAIDIIAQEIMPQFD